MSLVISVLAFAVAVWAAAIAWSQLRIQKDVAGGRGVLFDVRRPWKTVLNGVETHKYTVFVEVFGPGILYEASLHLERDGHELDEGDLPGFVEPLVRKSLGCNDDPLNWEFELSPNDTANLWCILSWVDPRAQAIWTGAYARKLTEPDQLYEWRWYRTRRLRRRLQSLNMRYRPLGEWQKHRDLDLEDEHGPFNLGLPPA